MESVKGEWCVAMEPPPPAPPRDPPPSAAAAPTAHHLNTDFVQLKAQGTEAFKRVSQAVVTAQPPT